MAKKYRLKNAAATKKLAIFDALEILSRMQSEEELMDNSNENKKHTGGFAERRANK